MNGRSFFSVFPSVIMLETLVEGLIGHLGESYQVDVY